MRVQVLGLILFVACAPSSSGPGSGTSLPGKATPAAQTYRAECEVTCRDQAEEAGCPNTAAKCIDGCLAMTSGLATLCGKCVAAQTEIYGDDEGGCSVELGTIEYSACEEQCGGGTPDKRPDFGAECQAQCDEIGVNASCAPNCVSDCMAMTAGLATMCGKCVALQTEGWNDDGACEVEVGEIGYSACEGFCGQPENDSPRADFRAECEVGCRVGGCDSSACVSECLIETTGLSNQCGKCVATQIDIWGDEEEPGGTCSYEMASALYSTCEDFCPPELDGKRPDFRAECELVCRQQTNDSGCSAPTCVSDCMAMTNGLDTQCGKCVAAQTYIYGDDEGGCELEVGSVEFSACDSYCQR